ncbi:hypothetical protein EDB89DRAFT_1904747 [Lactarius sanguifluus]|nr:hypothetical protein EDB89DRAFT_1904747 [Lactarius sanguifluus]
MEPGLAMLRCGGVGAGSCAAFRRGGGVERGWRMWGQAMLLATAVVRPCRVGVATGLVVLRWGLWVSCQGLVVVAWHSWRGMDWGGHSGAWVTTRHLQCWGDSAAWGGNERKKKNNKNKRTHSKRGLSCGEVLVVEVVDGGRQGPQADTWRNGEAGAMWSVTSMRTIGKKRKKKKLIIE